MIISIHLERTIFRSDRGYECTERMVGKGLDCVSCKSLRALEAPLQRVVHGITKSSIIPRHADPPNHNDEDYSTCYSTNMVGLMFESFYYFHVNALEYCLEHVGIAWALQKQEQVTTAAM